MFSNIINHFKDDLEEFVSTVKNDASQVLRVNLGEEHATEAPKSSSSDTVVVLPKTLPDEFVPEEKEQILGNLISGTGFEQFVSSFEYEDSTEEQNKLLSSNDILRESYEAIVPDQLTSREFFCRYLYLKHLQRIQKLRQGQQIINDIDEDEIGWSADEEEEFEKSNPNDEQAVKIEKLTEENELLKEKCSMLQEKVDAQAARIGELESQLNQGKGEEEQSSLNTEQEFEKAPAARGKSDSFEHIPEKSTKDASEIELAVSDVMERDDEKQATAAGVAKLSLLESEATKSVVDENVEDEWDDWE